MTNLLERGRKLALSLMNLDDIVLGRELAGNGLDQLSQAGRSVVGAAVVGSGVAARAAALGAQIAAKSAKAATEAVKGVVPGADLADRLADGLDQGFSAVAEEASQMASHGVEIGRADGGGPSNPLTGEPWLAKGMGQNERWNTVLADSTVELARFAALPFTLGMGALETVAGTGIGQQLTRSSWGALSSFVDSVSNRTGGGTPRGRSEIRAMLLAIGMAPFWLAVRDMMGLGEGVSRAALGDGRKLHEALSTVLDRLERTDGDDADDVADDDGLGLVRALRYGSKSAYRQAPSNLLAALEDESQAAATLSLRLASAMVEDSAELIRLTQIYSGLLARLAFNSFLAVVNGWRDVDEIEDWVRAEEARRAGEKGAGVAGRAPASLEQMETVISAIAASPDDQGFFSRSTLDLARDTVFSYSARVLGRDAALERIERIFGHEAMKHTRDDCSLREEILWAVSARERDQEIAERLVELLHTGKRRLRNARNRAAERLESLRSADPIFDMMMPHRLQDRAMVLSRFVSLADQSLALHGVPGVAAQEAARQKVFARFEVWMA